MATAFRFAHLRKKKTNFVLLPTRLSPRYEQVLFSLPESAGVKSDREVSCPYLEQVAPFDRLKVRGETLFSHKVLFSFPFLSATQ